MTSSRASAPSPSSATPPIRHVRATRYRAICAVRASTSFRSIQSFAGPSSTASSRTTIWWTSRPRRVSISPTSSDAATSWMRSSMTRSPRRSRPSGSSSSSATSQRHGAPRRPESVSSGIAARPSSIGGCAPVRSPPAAGREADLLRNIFAGSHARPERIELHMRVRPPEQRDEWREAPQAIRLRVHLDCRVAPAGDEERRGHAGVRPRITLRVDPLESADRDALLVKAEIRAEHERIAFDVEGREVRLVHDDRDVHRKQEQPDSDHDRVAAGRPEDEDRERGERKERERRPEQRKVRADRIHSASLGRASEHIDREATLDLVESGADALVIVRGEARSVELAEQAQAVADRERHVPEVRGLARDTELELGSAVAVAAHEDRALDAVIEHARGMGVGADVLGAAARTSKNAHRLRTVWRDARRVE